MKLNQMNGMVNKMESDYRIEFEYFRIPEFFGVPEKGKPQSRDLVKYVRGEGFRIGSFKNVRPSSKGGQVCCCIGDETGTMGYGIADCSYADNFCYRVGIQIALGRAKKDCMQKIKEYNAKGA